MYFTHNKILLSIKKATNMVYISGRLILVLYTSTIITPVIQLNHAGLASAKPYYYKTRVKTS